MIIEGTRLWLTLFSIELTVGDKQVLKSLELKKCYSRSRFCVNQWILAGMMLMTIVFEKQDV